MQTTRTSISDHQISPPALQVKTLQKRLISKTEQVVNCDLLLQEKEKLYVELQDILAKQPGPRVAVRIKPN